jgi:hypothetical protein
MVTVLPRLGAFVPVALVAGLALAGCGGGDDVPASTAAAVPTTAAPRAMPPGHGPRGPLPGLDRVPQAAQGLANPGSRRVAEAWFDRVRRGDDDGAAELMADGARFVNGAIVLLRSRGARVEAAASLPCGAIPVDAGGADGGYVVLRLRLTSKAGAPPCDGAGAPVAVAIHVTGGRIDDWVRLDGASAAPPAGTPV